MTRHLFRHRIVRGQQWEPEPFGDRYVGRVVERDPIRPGYCCGLAKQLPVKGNDFEAEFLQKAECLRGIGFFGALAVLDRVQDLD